MAGAALVLSGCTTIVQGTAERDPNANLEDATRALLQPGNFPTKPRAALGKAGKAGNLVEAKRMAEVLVLPFEVDPELTKSGGLGNGVIKDAGAVIKAFPKPLQLGADHNFISGFTMIADNPGDQRKSLQTVLLRFASPEDAAVAADDMMSRTGEMTSLFDDKPVEASPASIPRYPDAKAVTWPAAGNTAKPVVLALTVRGPLILGQVAISSDGLEAAAELAAATLDKQIPALEGFTPTPVDKLADLPLDRDDLMARTIPAPPEDQMVYMGIYGPHGILAFSNDPPTDGKLFAETGVTVVALSGMTTYMARDADGAKAIVEQFAKTMTEKNYVESDGVPGLPESKCLTYTPDEKSYEKPRTYCVAAADRVAFETTAGQEASAHQEMAAQYLMLTAK